MNACPTADVVASVLDRSAPDGEGAAVRAHVAGCDGCLERHGALFELELWLPATGVMAAGRPGPSPAARSMATRLEPFGVAAALAAAVLLLARLQPGAPVPAPTGGEVTVVESELVLDERGAAGVSRRAAFYDSLEPDRLLLVRSGTTPDGLSWSHSRRVPLSEATDPMTRE